MLDFSSKPPPIKGKTYKLNSIKIKNSRSAKGDIKRIKRKATDWEKIFANHMSKDRHYLECIKNSQTSTTDNNKIPLEPRRRHCTEDG